MFITIVALKCPTVALFYKPQQHRMFVYVLVSLSRHWSALKIEVHTTKNNDHLHFITMRFSIKKSQGCRFH